MSLKVTVLDGGARRASGVRELARWLANAAPARARGGVTVALVGDAAMRRLNRRFRGSDHVTDVLSFPSAWPAGPARGLPAAAFDDPPLGDIVIARGRAARQARRLGHPLGTELRILALHGLLHLLGYDHEVDDGRMARVEARLRRRLGLPSGLIARSS